ncbi:MAG: M81 family peptidase [Deltaproteobacteria bacterium]|nr:MAG: M81 family peptidase [Deltaproteobacteria bacterium]
MTRTSPRIAYARISLESNALSPVFTTLKDFERTHLRSGQELHQACLPGGDEAPGFLRNAELSGLVRAALRWKGPVELVPLFSAWTVPGGPMSRETYDHFVDRLLSELTEAGDVDGVFLALHGALCVPGVGDPEGELLAKVRAQVGSVPIAVTFDLHANLTRLKVESVDLICAYRTNPHRDHAQVGERCANLLLRTLAGEIRPTLAWRSLPVVLGGGKNVDFLQPMRRLYRWMNRQERHDRVLYVNLFQNQLWLDHEEVGWATCVLTDGSPDIADRLADELAELCWEVRHEQPPVFPGPEEAIEIARQARWARRLGTVCMCDASDIVGAGGTGDNTRLLRALLEGAADLNIHFPVRDPVAIERLWGEPLGRRVSLPVGGTLDPGRNEPLPLRGRLLHRYQSDVFGRMALLQVDHVKVVITEGANLVMRPRFYKQIGLDPWKADVVVVKSLFPFRIFFAPMNRRTIYVRTQGITDFDAAMREIPWTHPVHPRDRVEDWRPADRRRRGLASPTLDAA